MFPDTRAPALALSLYTGALYPDGQAQSVFTLDTESMDKVETTDGSDQLRLWLTPGETKTLPGDRGTVTGPVLGMTVERHLVSDEPLPPKEAVPAAGAPGGDPRGIQAQYIERGRKCIGFGGRRSDDRARQHAFDARNGRGAEHG